MQIDARNEAAPCGSVSNARSIAYPTTRDRVRIAIITGAIAPYTNRLFDSAASQLDVQIEVLACETIEPQRKWLLPEPEHYTLTRLPGLRYHVSYTSHIYFNPAVVGRLRRSRPDIVFLDGFSPTVLLAALWAFRARVPVAVMTDGSCETDPGSRSRIHRLMREILIPRASIGIGASEDSLELLQLYGLPRDRGIVLPINSAWDGPRVPPSFGDRPFDILFSGSIDDNRKGALFFAEVIERMAAIGQRPTVRVVGDGPLRETLRDRFEASGIAAHFDGFLQQNDLPAAYSSAKLLLFPSRGDPWGLVANEALLCGTPVIGSPHAVSTVELVERFGVGIMLPLEADAWAAAALRLTREPAAWAALQERHAEACKSFSMPTCLEALREGIALATGRDVGTPKDVGAIR
ncbi:MAG: glycosyltransferase [Hyphomicrobiaceae bacterium]|nr:glycosyltransferase [Hyphomicrobiaceae bacterium]